MMSVSLIVEDHGRWQFMEYKTTAEDPLSLNLADFKEWVACRVIGPSGSRCKVVKEEQTEVQREVAAAAAIKPGAKAYVQREVHVQQTLETLSIDIRTQQPEWSACFWTDACLQAVAAGVPIEHMLFTEEGGSPELPLDSQESLGKILAVREATQEQLYQATMARLTAKLLNESEDKQLQAALMAEGAAGLWDLASDTRKQQKWGLTGAALRGLMAALRKPVLAAEMQLPAVCAVWHVLVMAKARTRLVQAFKLLLVLRAPYEEHAVLAALQLGIVEALLHIVDSAFRHLNRSADSSPTGDCQSTYCGLLALLSASLGALAVLVVDSQAREHLMANRVYLKLLADIAATPQEVFRQHAESTQEDNQQQQQQSIQPVLQQETLTVDTASAAAGAQSNVVMPKLKIRADAQAVNKAQTPGSQDPMLCEVVSPAQSDRHAIKDEDVRITPTGEQPIDIPPALLLLQPQRLAAELLAALLLRDYNVRMACWGGGSSHYLLCLTAAQDPCIQLCGAAAVASMARAFGKEPDCQAVPAKDCDVLLQMHASLHKLLFQAVHRQQERKQEMDLLEGASAQGDGDQFVKEVDEMLLEYGTLALWVVNAMLAPELNPKQVYGHLEADGHLFQSCLKIHGAANTSPTVILCLSGAICNVAATQALRDAAADSSMVLDPVYIVKVLQPALSSVLQVETTSPEITHAKLLAAATVMSLAACERKDATQPCPSSCVESKNSSEQGRQQLLLAGELQPVKTHPPLKGIFRHALLSSTLLSAMINVAMHTPDKCLVEHDAHHAQLPSGAHPQQATVVLLQQVVAAACRMLVAVKAPLSTSSCAQVLEFVCQQCICRQASMVQDNNATAAAESTGVENNGSSAGLPPASVLGMTEPTVELLSCSTETSSSPVHEDTCTVYGEAAMTSQSGVCSGRIGTLEAASNALGQFSQADASCYAAILWGLSQHENQQQQLVLDGRWAQLLERLMMPALHRVKRAAVLGTKRTAAVVGCDANGSSDRFPGTAAAVPRLQLQQLHNICLGSCPQTVAATDEASSCSNKRGDEAAGVLQVCLQTCWLLLQQEARLRSLASELPADLEALYVKGVNTYWALEMKSPGGPELSESAKLALSLLIDVLSLPDLGEVCMRLKTLALDSCWSLTSDKVMHTYLIDHGLAQCVASICNSAVALQSDKYDTSSTSPAQSAAEQLLLAAAGYLTAAIQEKSVIQALGGEEASVHLLVQLLTSCHKCREPININATLLSRILSSLAWLSSKRDTAAACCNSRVVTALLDALRLERLAYSSLSALVQQSQPPKVPEQQQCQQAPQEVRHQKGYKRSAGDKRLQRCKLPAAQTRELQVLQLQSPQEQNPVRALPGWVLQAPISSLQQPGSWLQTWLERQTDRPQSATSKTSETTDAALQRCASSGHHLGPGGDGQVHGVPCKGKTPTPEAALRVRQRADASVRPATAPCLGANSRAHSAAISATPGSGVKTCLASKGLLRPGDASRKANGDRCLMCAVSSQQGTEGMVALWALLNISTHPTGQVVICKRGLYTLIRLVQQCPDPQRASVAAAILDNLTNSHQNAAMIYKAELRLKHAALLKQAGMSRVKSNPAKVKQAQTAAVHTKAVSATDAYHPPVKHSQQDKMQTSVPGVTNTKRVAQFARRTSKLELAAESGVLTAVLGTTFRAMPESSISGEEHKAGVLLSRAGELTSRGVEPTFKLTAPAGYQSVSGSGGRPRTSTVAASGSSGNSSPPLSTAATKPQGAVIQTGSFGSDIADYVPAAAGTPRSGRSFFFSADPGAAATSAVGVSTVQQGQDTKAGFMRWLQEQIPEAVGASDCTIIGNAKTAPAVNTARCSHDATDASAGRLQGLAKEADLTSMTTQDAEEAEWIEQQRVAQELHDFYEARAAQGALLRGSLGNSLRSSYPCLWSQRQLQASGREPHTPCNHLHQQSYELPRPQSAPADSRGNSRSCGTGSSSLASSPNSAQVSAMQGRTSSRPSSAHPVTARTQSCFSPKQSAGHSRVTTPCSRQLADHHGIRHSSDSCRDTGSTAEVGASQSKLQPLNVCSIDPWSPAVVAYEQLTVSQDIKPWRAANQLMLVGPEDEVVQKLAEAATSVLNGRLPCKSPPDVLSTNLLNKEALYQMQQQNQVSKVQQLPSSESYEVLDTQPGRLLEDFMGPESPGSTNACAGHILDHSSLPMHGQEPNDFVQTAYLQPCMPSSVEVRTHGTCEKEAGRSQTGAESVSISACSSDHHHHPEGQHDMHVTWVAGTVGGSADGTAAAASAVDGTQRWQGPGNGMQQATGAQNPWSPCTSSSMKTRNAEEDWILLQRPSTGYAVPNYGMIAGKQYIPGMHGMFSAAVADSWKKHRKGLNLCHTESISGASKTGHPDPVPASIPRPITVLDTSCKAAVRPVQVHVRGIDDESLPQRAFCFYTKEPPTEPALAMHVFQHIDGAKFCDNLFGHYLLPNGKLAHLFVPPAAVKQGYTVILPLPPATPWSMEDWLLHGLPNLPDLPLATVLHSCMQPGVAAAQLPLLDRLNWVPVPQLAPKPSRCTLASRQSEDGSLVLEHGPLRLKVVVHRTLEQRQFQKPLSAKTPKQRPSTAGAGTAERHT